MGWVGGWLGSGGAAAAEAGEPEPTVIPGPFEPGDPEFVDIIDEAIQRITNQFTGD